MHSSTDCAADGSSSEESASPDLSGSGAHQRRLHTFATHAAVHRANPGAVVQPYLPQVTPSWPTPPDRGLDTFVQRKDDVTYGTGSSTQTAAASDRSTIEAEASKLLLGFAQSAGAAAQQ